MHGDSGDRDVRTAEGAAQDQSCQSDSQNLQTTRLALGGNVRHRGEGQR